MSVAEADAQRLVRVAVTQAEPVWLDLQATVDKTCRLITEAASQHAKLISFPECWIPGYPAWIWSRPVDVELTCEYMKNSLQVNSPQLRQIQETAAAHGIVVVIGFSETLHHSLYISQAIIGSDGTILKLRRKMKPTHMERTIFGDASADTLNTVADTNVGKVGALSCWEHVQPLLKYHTYTQREHIHVAAWPPLFDHAGEEELWSMSRQGTEAIAALYAIESQSFVLHTTAVITQAGVDKMKTQSGMILNRPGGGSSAVFGPDGRKLSTDIPETDEGIIYADLDMSAILKARAFLDVCGHYSRPDLLWLSADEAHKPVVKTSQ